MIELIPPFFFLVGLSKVHFILVFHFACNHVRWLIEHPITNTDQSCEFLLYIGTDKTVAATIFHHQQILQKENHLASKPQNVPISLKCKILFCM